MFKVSTVDDYSLHRVLLTGNIFPLLQENQKTIAEITDRAGAPNLTTVEELDESGLSEVSIWKERNYK